MTNEIERTILKYSEEDNLQKFREKYGNLKIKSIKTKRVDKNTIKTFITTKEQNMVFNLIKKL